MKKAYDGKFILFNVQKLDFNYTMLKSLINTLNMNQEEKDYYQSLIKPIDKTIQDLFTLAK
jgi:hypothetical protein